jgi:hypothetical protein
VEQEQSDDVTGQPQRSDNDDQLGVRDLADVEEPFNGFHEDRETQGEQEDTVDERSEDFGSLPSVRVFGRYREGNDVDVLSNRTANTLIFGRYQTYMKAWLQV